tara:strand:+ start:40283 stop:40852 length:570 start_codon:yes stop_codon:yes gene_type:complete
MTRLTNQAHQLIVAVLQPGESAIDATAGNGHDTLFLCQTVGPEGRVFAWDIQQTALDQTASVLERAGFSNCELLCCDHSRLGEITPADFHQRFGAIMFNLGYLPGGDHCQITQTDSTLAAINASFNLLRPGGILTILAYPGHSGGATETEAVSDLLAGLDPAAYQTELIFASSESASAPRLFVVRKQAS